MGMITVIKEVKLAVAPSRLFKAVFLDGRNFLPKILPNSFDSIELLEGDDGGVGSITRTNFPDGNEDHKKSVTSKVEEQDVNNYYVKLSLIDGDGIGEKLERVIYEAKFEESENDGCVVKQTSYYYPLPDVELNQDEYEARREKSMGIYKVAEKYLLANPLAYV